MMSLFCHLISVLVALAVLSAGSPAAADVFRTADYTLSGTPESSRLIFTADIPREAATRREPVWPAVCKAVSYERLVIEDRFFESFDLSCERLLEPADKIRLPWVVDGAVLTVNLPVFGATRAIAGGAAGVEFFLGETEVRPRTFLETAHYFTWQGMLHIWIGWDHLAFVLCLCLLRSGKRLIALVTAFTLGHSISLAFSFLGLVQLPIGPVEALIALSIVFMAREAFLRSTHGVQTEVHAYGWIVTAFGLLHGLGFASALGELGVGRSEQVGALVFFNLGVEIGQLVFVAGVAAVLYGQRWIGLERGLRGLAAAGAGMIGGYWTIERIAGFPWT